MIRVRPEASRTDTLIPYTTRCRSMSHCEPTRSRFSILMLNNVVERTSRCFWISHHVPESAVAVLAAKKSAPLELRNDFLRERIEVYGHDRETDHETVTSTVPVPVLQDRKSTRLNSSH